jgi:hypothetical protein
MSQPKPCAGQCHVTPYARSEFERMLSEREQQGILTYGTTLQTFNGRDAVQDALEEAVDLWQYLVQLKMERDVLRARMQAADRLLRRWHEVCAQSCGGSEDVAYAAEQLIGEGE